MTWNYRTVRTEYIFSDGRTEPYYAIHTVYYEKDEPMAVSASPVIVGADTADGLRSEIKKFEEAIRKPILDMKDLGERRINE